MHAIPTRYQDSNFDSIESLIETVDGARHFYAYNMMIFSGISSILLCLFSLLNFVYTSIKTEKQLTHQIFSSITIEITYIIDKFDKYQEKVSFIF